MTSTELALESKYHIPADSVSWDDRTQVINHYDTFGIFDRWGDDCEELQDELTRLYSHSSFTIENHGLTGSRVGNALWRGARLRDPRDGAVGPRLRRSPPRAHGAGSPHRYRRAARGHRP